MSSPSQWLRRNSERFLLEAAQADMARRYLGRIPQPSDQGLVPSFWRRVFVPVYRRIPWAIRRRLIVAMPGSHRRPWRGLGEFGSVAPPPLQTSERPASLQATEGRREQGGS
jgi:hypothetical protein